MTKRKRRLLIWTGSIFGIVAIAAAFIIANWDWNKAKGYISAGVSKATGRQLSINGDLKVDLGWISKVHMSQIQFGNASWSSHPQMADVGLLDAQIDLWQLLKGRLVLPEVTLSQVKVTLEKNQKGLANWEFPAAPSTPQNRTQFPVIEKLIVNDGTLFFTNQETKTEVELKLTQANAAGFLAAPVTLTAKGYYQRQPLTLTLEGSSYQDLKSSTQPYPLKIDIGVGKLKANIRGNLTEPLEMKGEDVTLDVEGDNMANLFPLIHVVFPSTSPYKLKGHLKHEGNVWSFSNFAGRVGGSDLAGTIRVDTGPKRPVMNADLVSNLLDFKDLAGFIGGDPNKSATAQPEESKIAANKAESERIFPDQRYDLERLRAMDADVRLRAKRILAPSLPIDNLNARLNLNNGVLRFTPATFGVADGRMEIYSTFDGSKQVPQVKIDARLRELDLKRFMGQSSFAQQTLSPIGGQVVLEGTGNSFRELMASASGNTFLMMSGGEISELLTRLVGLNVARAIGVAVRGDKPIPVRCALLNLQGTNGQMGVQTLVFDTANSVISGEGNIDLRDEKVNIVLKPVPKDFSPFSLRSFIRVTGGFKNLSAFPDPIKTGTESIFQKILNVLVMIVTSPIQPRDLGLGKDTDCDALIASVREQDTHGVVPKQFNETDSSKTKIPVDRALAQRHASEANNKASD